MDYQRLVDEMAAAMNVSSVPVQEQSHGSAATDLSTIFINPKFAASVESKSGVNGIRFVLAHELGHARGGARGGHEGEYAADRWAAQSIARLGLSSDPIHGVMSTLNSKSTATHPAGSDRASAAQSAWEEASRPLVAPAAQAPLRSAPQNAEREREREREAEHEAQRRSRFKLTPRRTTERGRGRPR
jgi:hypothetical protein